MKFVTILIPLIMLVFSISYGYQITKGKVKPAISTWLIMFVGIFLSYITYLIASGWNFVAGILNFADLLAVIIILFSILIFSKTKLGFKPFEKVYLFIAGAITLFWLLTKKAFVSNLLTQALIWVGYFPTIQKLLEEKKNTESYFSWSLALLAGILSLFPTIKTGNILSSIYVFRTIVMVTIILILMRFYDRKINS